MQHTDDITKLQWRAVWAIYHLIQQPLLKGNDSAGINKIKQMIEDFISDNTKKDTKKDPKELLEALKNEAIKKNNPVKNTFSAIFKGEIKEAGKHAARAGKTAGGLVDKDVKDFYKILGNIFTNDPYEFYGDSVTINKVEYPLPKNLSESSKPTKTTEKRPSSTELDGGDKKRQSLTLPKATDAAPPIPPRSKQRFSVTLFQESATLSVKQQKAAHQLMKMFEVPVVKYQHDDQQTAFMRIARKDIETIAVGSSGRNNTFIQLDDNDEDAKRRLMDLVERYRAVYHPKFDAGKAPSEPQEFMVAFANVQDLFRHKNVDDFTLNDFRNLQKQCTEVYRAYQTIESELQGKPTLKN